MQLSHRHRPKVLIRAVITATTRGAPTQLSFRAPITMSASVGNGESYPGRSFTVSQLVYAAKRKLQGTMFAGRCA